jgi:hypothetical protein
MTVLSEFMQDMRSSSKKVLVSEKQLRDYAQTANEIARISEERKKRINKLLDRIACLEATIAVHHLEQETIDLTA